MSFSPSARQLAEIITKLRAAGCVFAEDEARLLVAAAGTAQDLDALAAQRAAGLPLEQVVGWAEFCGLRVAVVPGVFVPRRRSEFLVGQAVERGRELAGHGAASGGQCLIADLCCGTGAVGLAIAMALSPAELHAADIDPVSVACARENLAGRGHVHAGDLYEALPTTLLGRVDLLVANAPYVPTGEIALLPAEARLHEPRVALDGGADGVALHRRIAAAAPQWLSPHGYLLIETSEHQAPLTAAAVTGTGLFATIATDHDWSATVVIGARGDEPG
jgi:release factor glutamine methyltransferase